MVAGELKIQQLKAETYFFRRTNMNAAGNPRSWVDHLLWHHACHTVDLFQYQTQEEVSVARGVEGPHHPELGIAMDMAIQMKTPSGAVCALSLSFNNKAMQGTFFRYICDNGTYVATTTTCTRATSTRARRSTWRRRGVAERHRAAGP